MPNAPHQTPTSDPEAGHANARPARAADASRIDRVELLGSIAADLLMADGDPDRLVRHAYERLAEHLDLEVYVNYLVDEQRGGLRLQSCAGIDDPVLLEQLQWLSLGQAVCGTVARDGDRRVVEHVLASDEPITEFIRSIGIRAYACHPLVARERTIGTLSFGTRRRDSFEADELELMHAVSDLAAAAFDRAALMHALEERANELDRLARFQSLLLNSMSQAVIATDSQNQIVAWNERAEELYGWSAEEAKGQNIYELTVPEPSREQAEAIMAALAAGEPWSGEFMVSDRSGRTFLARVRNAPMQDEAGNNVGVIGLSEDITEERRRDQLARRNEQRRSEWLAFVSHELRSPLTTLVGFAARLLRRAHADEQFAPIREEAELLASEARRMERSIELLLRVAALDMDRVRLEPQSFYCRDVIEAEIKSVGTREPRATFEVVDADDHLSLDTDEGAVRLILRNLLENAVKYGGDPEHVVVHVETTATDEVTVAVSDNGNGIPAEELPRIFDRYYRGDAAAAASPGLGLGLHISHELAQLLSGRLEAESEPGQGARFRLTIPRELPRDASA